MLERRQGDGYKPSEFANLSPSACDNDPVSHRTKEIERAELHKTIWRIANDLRGSVDGWDFKTYVLGMLFYRSISENLTAYLNESERQAGNAGFDYRRLTDADAEFGREETVKEKGFYILPSQSVSDDVGDDWRAFISQRRDTELDAIIATEALKGDEARTFVTEAFRDGSVPITGTAITKILPPASRFSKGNDHAAKKQRVLGKIVEFFERYASLI